MTSLRTLPQSFVGGEISPKMWGRLDDPKYAQGAALLRNMVVEPSGTARTAVGTEFVHATRGATKRSRLITFHTPAGQSIFIELGLRTEYPSPSTVPGYARFHTQGATLLHSVAWSAATAYAVGDVVASGGSHYRCRLANTNQTPPNGTYWETLDYVANKSFPVGNVNTGADTITFSSNHNLETGEPVEFTNDGGVFPVANPIEVLIGGVPTALTTAFAIVISPTVIQVSATPGGTPLDLYSQGTVGPHRMHRNYSQGDLASQSGFLWYCRKSRAIDPGTTLSIPANAGNETYWYQEPTTGEYEVPTTFAISEAELFAVTYSQQADTMTLATGSSAPGEIQRVSAQTWLWNLVSLTPSIATPTGVAVAATKRGLTKLIGEVNNGVTTKVRILLANNVEHGLLGGVDNVYIEGTNVAGINGKWWAISTTGTAAYAFDLVDPETGALDIGITAPAAPNPSVGTIRVSRLNSNDDCRYKVSALDINGSESVPSAEVAVTNNLFVTGAQNTVTWSAVTGAVRYRVYKKRSDTGLFGVLGVTEQMSFVDDASVAPQIGDPPPILDTTLAVGAGTWPRAVTHFEGRRCFAGTDVAPQDVWLTKTNTEGDLSYGIPVRDTDRIHERLKSRIACMIRHLIDVGQLVALGDTTEFRMTPKQGQALTPDTFASRSQSYVGAAVAQPEIVQNTLVFAGERGGHIYQMAWRDDVGGFLTSDLCERATHLFDGFHIVQMASQLSPVPILWCLRSDGKLLGLTFVPSQQVFAWHQHDTDGVIESVAVGGEGGEDRAMLVVQRTVNGSTVRYVERMASFSPQAWGDSWQVDCGLRYTGVPTGVISGLSHLEGRTVAVFADGLVQSQKTVVGGVIGLDAIAAQVLVGLPRLPQVQTLPAAFSIDAYGSGRPKSVSRVWVRVQASGPFRIGPSLADMEPASEIPAGAPYSGLVMVRVPNEWTWDGQLFLEVADPVPVTIVSITAEMAVGG